jgi:hypothetical protein
LLVDFGSFHSRVDNDSFNYTVTRHRWNCQELKYKLNRDIHFTCILRLLNNTCVKHNFKIVHVSNLFWSREYNSAKEICKYPSFSKVGGNYPLELKNICFLLVDFGTFHSRVDNDSFNYAVTRHRWNWQELKYIIFRSALIHALAHFQRSDQSVHITHTYCCVSKLSKFGAYLYSRVHNNTFLSLRNSSSYLLRKTAFICNIDRDWMIYRKHPIRSLLTSMLRKANIRYPLDVYDLSKFYT